MGGRNPVAVPAWELDQWQDRIGWHLEQFCANGQWTPQDLLDQIKDRQRQLWVVEGECVLLTSVLGDRLSTVQVSHCAGQNYTEWLDLWAVIEGWAREIGAQRIEVVCRPGWEKPLAGFGLRKTHVILEKRL